MGRPLGCAKCISHPPVGVPCRDVRHVQGLCRAHQLATCATGTFRQSTQPPPLGRPRPRPSQMADEMHAATSPHLVLALHPLHIDVEVQLPHATNDGLPTLSVYTDLQGSSRCTC